MQLIRRLAPPLAPSLLSLQIPSFGTQQLHTKNMPDLPSGKIVHRRLEARKEGWRGCGVQDAGQKYHQEARNSKVISSMWPLHSEASASNAFLKSSSVEIVPGRKQAHHACLQGNTKHQFPTVTCDVAIFVPCTCSEPAGT